MGSGREYNFILLGIFSIVILGTLGLSQDAHAVFFFASTQTIESMGNVGSSSSVTIGTDGFPIISYYDRTNLELKVAHCTNANCSTFDTLQTLDSTGIAGRSSSIAIGTDGFPIISYLGDNNLRVAHCTNVICSTSDTPQTINSAGNAGIITSIAIGTDGFPIISYLEVTELKVVHCTNAICSATDTPQTIDGGFISGGSTSIAIGADGFPIISYFHGTSFDLKVAHCTNASCSATDAIQTIDSTGFVGRSSSIAIGTDGFPIISYNDGTNDNLKVAHCTNVNCSTFDALQTIDSTGDVGSFSSITIGTDGFPIISYYDETNGDLKVAHCTNVNCSTFDTPQTIDNSSSNLGRSTSIAVDSDGFPIISYYDITNEDLKVAHAVLLIRCGSETTLNVSTNECEADVTQSNLDFLQGIIDDLDDVIIGLIDLLSIYAPFTETECDGFESQYDKKILNDKKISNSLQNKHDACIVLYP